ncbi:MAG: D-alanyl-D-alanine carboxypeptidase, partial [Duncaniella sp.]|nr:D-alanyl-D-alanine carboxypeptidase [Duncaniella sp.]
MNRISAFVATILYIMCSGFVAGAFPLDVKGLDTTRTAVMVYDLTFGRPIVQANVTKPLIPASIMKSVTAASVLNLADSYERFMTPVVAEGVA